MKPLRIAAAVLLAAGPSSVARAGEASYTPVYVDEARGIAYGSLYDTRRTADSYQAIGCDVSFLTVGGWGVSCFAYGPTGRVVCWSNRTEFVTIASSLTDHGFLRFHCAGSRIQDMWVSKASKWLP